MDTLNFSFRPLQKKQEQLIIDWLHKPHVKKWYHGVGLKNTIKGIKMFLKGEKKHFDAWVAYINENPFAFIMTFELTEDDRADPDCHQAKWMEHGSKTSGMDLLIGEEVFLGQGLAAPMIKNFLSSILKDSKTIFIDPEKANTRAIHVYKKAGFEEIDSFIASWHPVPHVLMRFEKTKT